MAGQGLAYTDANGVNRVIREAYYQVSGAWKRVAIYRWHTGDAYQPVPQFIMQLDKLNTVTVGQPVSNFLSAVGNESTQSADVTFTWDPGNEPIGHGARVMWYTRENVNDPPQYQYTVPTTVSQRTLTASFAIPRKGGIYVYATLQFYANTATGEVQGPTVQSRTEIVRDTWTPTAPATPVPPNWVQVQWVNPQSGVVRWYALWDTSNASLPGYTLTAFVRWYRQSNAGFAIFEEVSVPAGQGYAYYPQDLFVGSGGGEGLACEVFFSNSGSNTASVWNDGGSAANPTYIVGFG